MPEFSYSGNPADSKRDEVRFLLQDTDDSRPLLYDAELDYIIDYYGVRFDDSAPYMASIGAGVIARKFAGVVSISADGVSVQIGDLSARYTELASALRLEHSNAQEVGGAVDLANLMWESELDHSIAALNFSIGMHDNPSAGQQAYGGHKGPSWNYDTQRWV